MPLWEADRSIDPVFPAGKDHTIALDHQLGRSFELGQGIRFHHPGSRRQRLLLSGQQCVSRPWLHWKPQATDQFTVLQGTQQFIDERLRTRHVYMHRFTGMQHRHPRGRHQQEPLTQFAALGGQPVLGGAERTHERLGPHQVRHRAAAHRTRRTALVGPRRTVHGYELLFRDHVRGGMLTAPGIARCGE